MNKKKINPRTEFIIVRLTKKEKESIILDAGKQVSKFIREKLGFIEENE